MSECENVFQKLLKELKFMSARIESVSTEHDFRVEAKAILKNYMTI